VGAIPSPGSCIEHGQVCAGTQNSTLHTIGEHA
jgi:hypothetical protein